MESVMSTETISPSSPQTEHKCPDCSSLPSFSCAFALRRHRRQKHNLHGVRPVCHEHNVSFTRDDAYTRHFREQHLGQKRRKGASQAQSCVIPGAPTAPYDSGPGPGQITAHTPDTTNTAEDIDMVDCRDEYARTLAGSYDDRAVVTTATGQSSFDAAMVWVPELHMIQESNLESRVDCTYAAYGMLTGQYLSNSGASDDSSLCIVPEDSVIDLDSSTIGSRITSDTASISWSSRPSITSTLETDLSDGASWQKEAFLLPTLDTQVSLETEIGQIDQTTLPLSSFNDDDDDTDTEDSSHRRFSIYSDMDRSIASLSPAWTRKLRAKVSNATLTGSISSSAKSLLSSRWSRMSLEMPGPGLSTVDEELRLGRGSDLAVEPLWKIAAWKLGKAGRTVRDLRKLLRSCALSNDLFRLRLVLETGKVDPDHRFDDGETALLLAVEAGHIAVVECLLVTGHITPDLRDANGDTALARAAKRGRVDIMRLLLCRGAQPDTMNSVFRTPLHHSVFHKYDLATEELLRTGQVNVDAVDTCGHSPLSEASPSAFRLLMIYRQGESPSSRVTTTPFLDCREILPLADRVQQRYA